MAKSAKENTVFLLEQLCLMHKPSEWAFFDELRIGTGNGKDSLQRFDAWAIHYYPSKRLTTRCYEIKASVSDFKKELANPEKRKYGLRFSNEFWFVAPKGMLDHSLIPIECGLMEIGDDGIIEAVVPAPWRDACPPTWLFTAAISRRNSKDLAKMMDAYIRKQKRAVYEMKSLEHVLKDHIDKWRNFSSGSKEVPDKIAEALEDALEHTKEMISANERHL